MKDNLLLREEYAFFNAQLWMTNVGGLSMETLHGIARGEVIQASTGSQCYSFQILPVGKMFNTITVKASETESEIPGQGSDRRLLRWSLASIPRL